MPLCLFNPVQCRVLRRPQIINLRAQPTYQDQTASLCMQSREYRWQIESQVPGREKVCVHAYRRLQHISHLLDRFSKAQLLHDKGYATPFDCSVKRCTLGVKPSHEAVPTPLFLAPSLLLPRSTNQALKSVLRVWYVMQPTMQESHLHGMNVVLPASASLRRATEDIDASRNDAQVCMHTTSERRNYCCCRSTGRKLGVRSNDQNSPNKMRRKSRSSLRARVGRRCCGGAPLPKK